MSLIITPESKGIYRLTLAEILYYLPDYHDILQSYVWQEYDYIPALPNLHKFVDFWQSDIEGKIHSIKVSVPTEFGSSKYQFPSFFNRIH